MLVTALGAGCSTQPDERFLAQRHLGRRVLDEGRIEVDFDPGAHPIIEGPLQLRLRGSAPTPNLTVDYLGDEATDLALTVENGFDDVVVIPTRASLGDPGACAGEVSGDGLVFAPDEPTRVEAGSFGLVLDLPPCSRTRFQVRSRRPLGEAGGEPLRLAVIGETKGNLEVVSATVDRLIELRDSGEFAADVIVALGNLANSPEEIDLRAWLDAISEAELPLVVAIGRDELGGADPLPFHEVFGRSDFTFAIGDVRAFVLDTASAEMAPEQLDYWRGTMAAVAEPIRIAFMQTPPFDPSGFRDHAFTNRLQAAQLVALLGENGVDAVFTGGIGGFDQQRKGGIPFYFTGGGGGPIEAFSDVENHFLRVTIDPDDASIDVEVEEL